ncbi:MAG: hypothetical protein JWQ35_369 [Bacteriovoracaceae bacterium]|nr:hypothetical protein [Bacteriovoracaceae bacterium]
MNQKIGFALFLLSTGISSTVYATLGDNVSTIENDRAAMSSEPVTTKDNPNYKIYIIKTDSAIVREYVSKAGIIFSVGWNGNAHPDTKQLLGKYWSEHCEALKRHPREPGKRIHKLVSDRLVSKKEGVQGAVRGYAYDPTLVPKGVNVDEIS